MADRPIPDSEFELIETLNERELEILALFAQPRTNQEVADTLYLSLNTVKWYARQIYGKLGVNNRREAVSRAEALGLIGYRISISGLMVFPNNLPGLLTPFVGRQEELANIHQLLLDPDCRLLTLIGPGGMGKTRLSLQIASLLVVERPAQFKHGIYFVPVATLSDLPDVVSAVADAVGYRFSQLESAPEQQLGQFLRQKKLLLVVDNLEHLVNEETVCFITDLLATAPDITLLTTSRIRLNIQGEQLYPLGGLDVPADSHPEPASEDTYSGLQLFIQTARRASPGFMLNEGNIPAVVSICRLVSGMPLAIELAAAWAAILQPHEILAEIKEGLDFLASDASNLPERHRSLPVVLDASWRLLTSAEREGLRRLSVFLGGFSNDAARQVAEVSPKLLLGLATKSWLVRDNQDRYRVLEMLRQYGAQKLGLDNDEEAEVRLRHSLYYCQWLAERELIGKNQQLTFENIALEIDNARAAFFWAVKHEHYGPFILANRVLYLHYRRQGDFVTGDRHFRQLAEELQTSTDVAGRHALAMMLTWRCAFQQLSTNNQGSELLADEVLAILSDKQLQSIDTRDIEAHIALWKGYINYMVHPDKAWLYFLRSYGLSEDVDDPIGMAVAQVGLGRIARNLNQTDEAEIHIKRAIQLHESAGNLLEYDDALRSLGSLACRQQNFAEAERLLNQALAHRPPNSRFATAHTLSWFGQTYYLSGQFHQAAVAFEQCLALNREQGVPFEIAMKHVRLSAVYRELGDYETARAYAETALVEFEERKMPDFLAMSLALLGSMDLVENMPESAYERLQKGVSNQPERIRVYFRWGHQAWLGIAARARGRQNEAWSHLRAELRRAYDARLYMPMLTAFAGLALLFTDDDEIERAIELVSLISEHTYIANAYWFEELISREVSAAAATLPDNQRIQAETRDKPLGLWQTAQNLTETLAER